MKVNITTELIDNHSDKEIIEYLSGVMTGVLKNYKVAVEKSDSALLYANLGDISQVASALRGLHKRDQERLANRPN